MHALREVDLELRRGEIMGIVGDNGAGKSTLMKVLSGAYVADEGEIWVNGQKARIRNPMDAANLGIGMIYQDLALFNNFDVAKNIFVGRELHLRPLQLLLDKKKMYKRAEELIRELKVDIKSPKQAVLTMSGGQRQMVACARAIAFESKILIMDEPTAALGVTEANKLLGLIKNLAEQGLSILLITQRIPGRACHRRPGLRAQGWHAAGVLDVSKVSLDDVVTLIVKGKDRPRARRRMSTTSLSDRGRDENIRRGS